MSWALADANLHHWLFLCFFQIFRNPKHKNPHFCVLTNIMQVNNRIWSHASHLNCLEAKFHAGTSIVTSGTGCSRLHLLGRCFLQDSGREMFLSWCPHSGTASLHGLDWPQPCWLSIKPWSPFVTELGGLIVWLSPNCGYINTVGWIFILAWTTFIISPCCFCLVFIHS